MIVGAQDVRPATPSLIKIHYMMLRACSRTKEQRLEGVVGQDTDQRERKTTGTGKNNNLEDKGGRGDRLSPVGILNPCGFNTPPQPVHSDFSSHNPVLDMSS